LVLLGARELAGEYIWGGSLTKTVPLNGRIFKPFKSLGHWPGTRIMLEGIDGLPKVKLPSLLMIERIDLCVLLCQQNDFVTR
jgi:hypothetical protein